MYEGVPKFGLISEERRYRSFSASLSALWETDPRVSPLRLNSAGVWPRERRAIPALFTSLLLHFSIGYFFYSVPLGLLLQRLVRPFRDTQEAQAPLVVYKLEALNLADYLPVQQPPAPGAAPGRGNARSPRAPRGSARRDPRVQVISNPTNPDNFKQTILQPNSPPKLTIPRDIPLPNLILGSLAPAPEAPKPPAPQPKAKAEVPTPHPAVAPKPAAPPIPPDLAMVPKLPPLPTPSLEVPALLPAPPSTAKSVTPLPLGPSRAAVTAETQPAAKPSAPAASQTSAEGQRGGAANLVSLSLNPTPLGKVIALPPGNRRGAFSIAAAGGASGSPGGDLNANVPAGSNGIGPGGDTSLAAGAAGSGGGGPGDAAPGAMHSVTGDTGVTGVFVGGTLPPLPPEKLVYPVDETAARLHRPGLVVSSSSGGGGGLEVYGVLRGRKIYTIYLPMPGKSWILQFCAGNSAPLPGAQTRVLQIQMEPLLVPPTAIDQFDFHRPPVQIDKPNPMIILHGSILADGSVGKLQILKGFGSLIDEAAAAAFARWKFSPALRGGDPVAVEVLVGIPAMAPGP
ncbi:MAG TPA: energy transducer TonB [Terriglobia bacterium]|nr:energy transducer TonB [Terriglobia bacterium]